MKRYKIIHQTSYKFPCAVELYPHTLRLMPKEGHELRIENASLDIFPPAILRWYRDVEENSVAMATFSQKSTTLDIESEITIQQFNQEPFDFLVADYAVDYPFDYSEEEAVPLDPYMNSLPRTDGGEVADWVRKIAPQEETIQTLDLLLALNQRINQLLTYRVREEEGVQSAEQTLESGSGSCRDVANLFMIAVRQLGFASRFVSGYLYSKLGIEQPNLSGSTHAWAEVFIPGAGWKGFDPTIGIIAGPEHIAVAVARLPESIPPIAGAFHGAQSATMDVNVQVTELNE